MNRANIEFALATMKQVLAKEQETGNRLTAMSWWQSGFNNDSSDLIAHSLEQLHTCGNTACLAGHLALTPEFQALGVKHHTVGLVVPNDNVSIFFSEWFGFKSKGLSSYLIFDASFMNDIFINTSNLVYGKDWYKVTTPDVMEVLEYLLQHGEKVFVQRMVDRLKSLVVDTKTPIYKYSFITLLREYHLFDQI